MNTYYERKSTSGFTFELCQNRFRNTPNHPHNVCAVATSHEELKEMYNKYLSGGVDWMLSEKIALNRLCESFSCGFGRITEINTAGFMVSYSRLERWYRFETSEIKFYNDDESGYYGEEASDE